MKNWQKLSKSQLRRLIAEERAKLVSEQPSKSDGFTPPTGGDLIGDIPSDLEENIAMAMQGLITCTQGGRSRIQTSKTLRRMLKRCDSDWNPSPEPSDLLVRAAVWVGRSIALEERMNRRDACELGAGASTTAAVAQPFC